MRRLGRFAEGVLEAGWLSTVALVPLFIDKDGAQAFEPAKAGVLSAIAVLMAVAWATRRLSTSADHAIPVAASARLATILRAPLFLPVVAFLTCTLVATLFSLSPAESVWGHRGRALGLVSLLAQLLIFAATAVNLRSTDQLRRLVTSLILPSLPIALYAVCQRVQLEPLLLSTDTEVERATSFFGQPVYLGAYLAMIAPFAVLRLVEAARDVSLPVRPRLLGIGSYGLVVLLQLTALVFTESRGPLLGLAVAGAVGFLAHAARRLARLRVLAVWVLTAGATALALAGAPAPLQRAATQALDARVATRAAETFSTTGGGGQFRTTTWKVAERVFANDAPLELADGSHDKHPGLRTLVGYGPELQYAISPPFYDSELPTLFGYFLVDRFHNLLWDTLLTTGMFGLTAWLALECMLFWLATRTLGLVETPRQRVVCWSVFTVSALLGAAAFGLVRGLAFCFLGLQVGAVLGLALFLSAASWSTSQGAPRVTHGSDLTTTHEGLIIAALAAIVGHLIETSFSFVTISTGALFWLSCALLVVCTRTASETSSAPRDVSLVALSPARQALRDAAFLGWPLMTIGFVFLGASPPPLRIGAVLWDGLTLLARPAGERAPVVMGLVLATWLGGALLLRLDRPLAARFTALGRTLVVAGLVTLVFWVQQASTLASRARTSLGTLDEVTQNLASRSASTTTFYVACLLLGLVFALASMGEPQKIPHTQRALPWWRTAAAAACLLLALPVIERISLRPAHAEAAVALGEALKANNRLPLAEHALGYATTLLPDDDVYRATLAKAYGRHARLDVPHASAWLERADQAMREAVALNPAASENATNLAVVGGQRALQGTPTLQPVAIELYARALRLHPLDPNLWRMWGGVQVTLLQDPRGALASARRALPLDPKNAAIHGLLAESLLALAREQSGESRTESLRDAAAAFDQAATLAPDQLGYRISSGKAYLALGQASKAANSFRLVLSRLPTSARERPTTVALLHRAESAASLTAVPPASP